ncbi:unnamed protein product [Polarella glacialis]|uniref:Uncharacterized protein n=1 Tax=Polarella glacialis TaxID=89957 RepID=A0A813E9A8_POLGL|nr:unnamed protein product [Polarella glacialis]
MSENFPIVPCLFWVFDSAQHNTKMKSNLMFALRQLCQLGQNKMKVGHHITSSLLNDLKVASAAHEKCATNLLLLLISLASVNTNALMMDTKIDEALSFCGIQGKDGVQVKSSKLAQLLWSKVMALKTRIKDAKLFHGGY